MSGITIDDEALLRTLQNMRESFIVGDYGGVLAELVDLGELRSLRSGIRIEAISLAARAYIALGSRREGRDLLRMVWNIPMKTHRQYRFLAQACLELGDYRRAAELATKAAEHADAHGAGAEINAGKSAQESK